MHVHTHAFIYRYRLRDIDIDYVFVSPDIEHSLGKSALQHPEETKNLITVTISWYRNMFY